MQFVDKTTQLTFEIPDEWWEAGRVSFTGIGSHYSFDQDDTNQVALIDEIEPPLRDGGLICFRDRDSVVNLLQGICNGVPLPPIQVWSKGKKHPTRYVVRNGLHRFYLSIAMGHTAIPIQIDDFDFDEFFANENQ